MGKYRPTESAYLNGEEEETGIKKVVINGCYGGFGLSVEASKLYLKKIGKEAFFYVEVTKYREEDKNEYEQTLNDLGYTKDTVPKLFTIYKKVSLEEAKECENDGHVVHITTKDLGDKTTDDKEINEHYWSGSYFDNRDDKILVETVEELGSKKASSRFAELRIVEVPEDVEFEIDYYDGIESIHEKHRSWY